MKRKESPATKSKQSSSTEQGKENHAPSAESPRTIRRTANGGVAYSDELVSGICERLRLGEHMAHILRSEGMPTMTSFNRWIEARPSLRDDYARARESQAQFWANQVVEIADESALTSEAINLARLRVDARKWVASKLIPRVYGDRVQTEVGRPGEFEAIDSARLLAEAIAARLGSPKLLEAQAIDITED